MRLSILRLVCLAGLLGGVEATVSVRPVHAQTGAEVAAYDETRAILHLKVPPGVRPVVQHLADPPRVVARWRSRRAVPSQQQDFITSWVRRMRVESGQGIVTVTLALRETLPEGFRARLVPGGVQVMLDPASFTARVAPQITFVKPSPRVTPVPVVPREPEPRRFPEPGARPSLPPRAAGSDFYAYQEPDLLPRPRRRPPEGRMGVVPPRPMSEREPRRRPQRRTTRGREAPVSAFPSRLMLGPEFGVAMREVFQAGRSLSNTPFAPGVGVAWEHWFAPQWGLALAARTAGYSIDSASARPLFAVRHRRDEGELNVALRGRWPLGWGLETMLHGGVLVRGVTALTSQARVNNGVVELWVPVDTTDYLSANWLAAGGELRGALAGRLAGPFGWMAYGEYRLTPGGWVQTNGVPGFFPLSGVRGGAELRADYFGLAFALGYSLSTEGTLGQTPANTLWQTGGLVHLRTGWVY